MIRPVSSSPPLVLAHFYQHPLHFISASITVFSMFSIITFLCLSINKKKSLKRNKEGIASQSQMQSRDHTKLVSKLNSKIGSKAVALAKMVSWRKVEDDGVDNVPCHYDHDTSDEAVWRKGILMGERCSPLNFSGKIVYDSEGNQLRSNPIHLIMVTIKIPS